MQIKSESEVAQLRLTLRIPWTAAYQAPPSMGVSRQEYWSGLPLIEVYVPLGEGNGTLLQYSCLENPIDGGAYYYYVTKLKRNLVTLGRWRRKWQPTPVFLPRESHGQRSLAGYSPWDCRNQTQLSH